MRNRIAILALAGLLAGPAMAATPNKNAPGTSVEMPAIIAPMDNADGRLAGYAYITCTIIASSPDVAVAIRSKTPFIQDLFVRDANGSSVALPTDPAQLDKKAVADRFLADARKIMGPGKVVSLAVTQVQMAALRSGPPSNTPQSSLPGSKADAAPQQKPPPPEKAGS
jgi:hypothetical protein